MELKHYTTFPEALKEDWNALLKNSITDTPFLRYEYLLTWWETLGGGEWSDAELCIIAAQRAGKLVGIAPLFFTNHDGRTALMLLGSIEVSDYLDVICSPDDLPEFIDALLDFLQNKGDLPGWQALDFYNLPKNSSLPAALQAACEKRSWRFEQDIYQPSPYIALSGDWDTYLAGIDKKQRHEIRRKIRRLEESGVPSRWYFVEDPAALESEMEAFLALMEQEGDKATFLTSSMRQHMRNTMRFAFDLNCLALAFLEIDGRKAAAKLCFKYNNALLAYNSGVERELMEYSPGWVLLGYLLQWANEQKLDEFDFMRGGEEYKYRFGAVDRSVLRVQAVRQ